ncbi:hypothetical protein CKAN_01188100 [Cinnamomum micranthum f. kanehirae]|uniref:Uncharacterized protein n=1 Tax=Cinnamomum micranthum f. kanehirae TaxID=337451 RepID=A0A3S3QDV4_9MAGN|nr:hypothetical protein CKAN_01188100 [Cinnamomum micranthum f. kanehirae]
MIEIGKEREECEEEPRKKEKGEIGKENSKGEGKGRARDMQGLNRRGAIMEKIEWNKHNLGEFTPPLFLSLPPSLPLPAALPLSLSLPLSLQRCFRRRRWWLGWGWGGRGDVLREIWGVALAALYSKPTTLSDLPNSHKNSRNRILSLPTNPRFLLLQSLKNPPDLKNTSFFIRSILRFPHEIRPSSLRSRLGLCFPH